MYSTPHGRGIPGSMTLSLTSTLACGTRALLMLLTVAPQQQQQHSISLEGETPAVLGLSFTLFIGHLLGSCKAAAADDENRNRPGLLLLVSNE